MNENTARWLAPMLDAADLDPHEYRDLIRQATMPASEADIPFMDWMAKNVPETEDVRHGALDWIRFGQLLRERLGWTDYPDQPAIDAKRRFQ